jgi:DNA polymerase
MVPPISHISKTTTSGPALIQVVKAAMAWWNDAGVDGDWSDAPQDWLAKAAPGAATRAAPSKPAEQVETPAVAGGRTAWPTDAAAFAAWWMTAPDLAPAGAQRVPPIGPAAPPLMIVVPMPESGDTDVLLSGPAGRLLDGFLTATGLSRDAVYCAAAIPSRIAAPDWAALAQAGLGELLAHHIALVRPQRLILFGQNGISTLMGNASTNKPSHLPSFNHDGGMIPVLSAYDLETIVARPALKAGLWSRWLDWMPA